MRKIFFIVAIMSFVGFEANLNAQTITLTYDAYGNRLTKSVTGNYPNPVLTGDSVVCQGDTAHFYASGGTGYLWSTGSTQSAITVPADSTRWYWVKVFNALGCDSTVKRLLTVKSVPVTSPITGDTLVAAGSTINYSVINHLNSIYDWSISPAGSFMLGIPSSQRDIQWTSVSGLDTITIIETGATTGCSGKPVTKVVHVWGGVNVPQEEYETDVSVYPNPASDGAIADLQFTTVMRVTISITDVKGHLVAQKEVNGKIHYTVPLEKSLFPVSGTYIIHFNYDSKETTRKLTIIN